MSIINKGINKKAFTLIEMLVVVLIIGILAAIALPQYQKTIDRTKLANLIQAAHSIKKAQELFYLQNGSYAAPLSDLDWDFSKICPQIDGTYLICKDSLLDNIAGYLGDDNSESHKVVIYYCPGYSQTKDSCAGNLSLRYEVYFNKSSKPNQESCNGLNTRGIYLCKSLGF